MRGHFSIEWMAQSSLPAESQSGPAPGPTTCGTHSESLPGFYCRQKSGTGPEQQEENTRPGLGAYSPGSLQQPPHTHQEPGFSSGTEEETSGYESEGGHSLSPSAPADSASTSPPSPPLGRRPRTAFTAEQISVLERAFKRNAYLGTQDKADLCKQLNLSDKQIRNWFQNRRMKLKRTMQDALAHACQANVASQFMHYSKLPAYRPGPYPRYPVTAAVAPEGPTAASYVHPPNLQYGSPLPLDSVFST
uniref:Ventrally expressed dharma/bozozok antagonist n=1 Tax=Mastacembelus armatus TaxID=205130 RepID=A0A3Q3LMM1_9TELE